MKRLLVIIACLLLSASARAGEMDLLLRNALGPGAGSGTWRAMVADTGVAQLVSCLVRTRAPGRTADAIDAAGGTVAARAGNVLSARIPAAAVATMAARPEVEVVEGAMPMARKMDTARYYSGVAAVQDGAVANVPYTGHNVVVGVIDSTLDWGHPDFVGEGGFTRIQYLRQLDGEDIQECFKNEIDAESCSIEDGGQAASHGTHVTGIAAGANETYRGVAPAADILFSFTAPDDAATSGGGAESFSTLVLDGAAALFGKADALDKPAVLNISLGTSLGAHDGTSLLEEGLTALTADRPGRIIVGAAGNEQVVLAQQSATRRDFVGGIHARIDVADGESRASRIGVWLARAAAQTYVGGTLVDLWLDAGSAEHCRIAAFGYTLGRPALDFTFPGLATTDDAAFATGDLPMDVDTAELQTATGADVTASVGIDAADVRNDKSHAMLLFAPAEGASSSSLDNAWYDVVVRAEGGSCTGHMWLYYDYTLYHDFLTGVAGGAFDVGGGAEAGYFLVDGDSAYTATIPSTAVGVISAGSWMPPKPVGNTASEWTGDNGTTYDQGSVSAPGGSGSTTGDLSDFSSLGPTADGRTKPDVVTPGEPIVAALASDVNMANSVRVGSDHFKNAGTSMAAPHLTGIVALLLERNNTLGVEGVRAALRTGATTDGMTAKTADPENSYGTGKAAAAAALASVDANTSAYSGTGDLSGPNIGCALMERTQRGWGVLPGLLLLVPLLLFLLRRRLERQRAHVLR